MLKVVLDTNTFISGTIHKKGVPALILDLWRQKKFVLVSSLTIIDELVKVLHYPHIQDNYKISEAEISALILEVKTRSLITSENINLQVITDDPSDNKFLEAAVEGQADYLVSGDKHLKTLETYQQTIIVSPAEYLNVLKK